jgi:hypothetical protein
MRASAVKGALFAAAIALLMPGTSAAQTSSTSAEHNANCPNAYHRPLDPLYRDIDQVALVVDVPILWQQAFECHGHEEECAKKAHPGDAMEQKSYVRQLSALYQPHSTLSPSFITQYYVQHIRGQLSFFAPGENCRQPTLRMGEDAKQAALEPHTLVVLVQVVPNTISDKPEVVTLRTVSFRTDLRVNELVRVFYGEYLTPIFLGWPAFKIDGAVRQHLLASSPNASAQAAQ